MGGVAWGVRGEMVGLNSKLLGSYNKSTPRFIHVLQVYCTVTVQVPVFDRYTYEAGFGFGSGETGDVHFRTHHHYNLATCWPEE